MAALPAADDTEYFRRRAAEAENRKNKLKSFGPQACGVFVKGKYGLFVVDPQDGYVAAQLLQTGSYSEYELVLAQMLISKEANVLIVGAHIGALAVPISKCCNQLIAIEANPYTFNYLSANLLLNNCKNVKAIPVAASDKTEKINFLLNSENSGGSKRMPATMDFSYTYDSPQTVEIDAGPLDDLIDIKVFDYVLMDIEGSEYFALKGMQKILQGTKALAVEFIPQLLKNVANVSVEDFLGQIMPHFDWLFIPALTAVIPKENIVAKLETMYQANEPHEGLVFLKDPLPDWLKKKIPI